MSNQEEKNNQIIIYNTEDGETKIEVKMKSETVWLSQKQMAELFDKDRKTITEHIQNVFKEGELAENSACRKFQHTAADGKKYNVNPNDLKGYYLNRPADAFKVMRELGLGITNDDIRKIDVGEI